MTRQPKFIVKLDIGIREEEIFVYEGDEIRLLAQYFCDRHKLPQQCLEYIVGKVQEQELEYKKNKYETPEIKKQDHDYYVKSEDLETGKQPIEEIRPLKSKIQEKLMEHYYNVSINRHKKQKSSIYDKLYMEAQELRQHKQELTQIQKTQSRIMEEKEITFHPQISPSTDRIIQKLKRNQTCQSVTDYLYEESSNMQKRKQNALQNRFNFMKEKPAINKISKMIMEKLSRSKSAVHERLYQNSKERAKTLEEKQKQTQLSFIPIVHKQRSQLEKSKKKKSTLPNKQEELFHPKINKSDYHLKIFRKKFIEDKILCEQINTGQIKLNSNRSSEIDLCKKNKKSPPQKQRNYEAEREAVLQLFNLLDSDCDGMISCNNMDFRYVDFHIIEIISDVLEEIDLGKLELNYEQFFTLCSMKNKCTKLCLLFKRKPTKRYDQSRTDYFKILHKK